MVTPAWLVASPNPISTRIALPGVTVPFRSLTLRIPGERLRPGSSERRSKLAKILRHDAETQLNLSKMGIRGQHVPDFKFAHDHESREIGERN